MTSPVRSETALIRPFAQIDQADAALGGVRLVINADEHLSGAIVLAEEMLAGSPLILQLPSPEVVRAAVEQTVVPWQDCGLVVLASARTNRISRVIVQEYLKPDAWPETLSLTREISDLILADRAGFSLVIAIVLLHDLTPAPLRPYMAGTWLARREFTLSPEREAMSFSPEELTDEIREYHELPKNVMRYVYVGDWQDAEVLSDEVRIYVDPEVLNLLLGSPSDSHALQMQVELAILAMETIASTIARELSDDGTKIPSAEALAPFGAATRFFESLSRETGTTLEDLLDCALREPSRLRAHLEAAFNAKSVTVRALKEN